jgi:hypothetical protein
LSRYPVLTLKVSSDADILKSIKTQSILIFESSWGDTARAQLEDWKPDYNKRTVRRFLTGNILNGIVEANKRKENLEIKSWSLVRFKNYDGTIDTGIELRYDEDISNKKINAKKTELSISVSNPEFLKFFEKMPVSYDDISGRNIFPLWNIISDRLIDRSI